ncbi:MAG: FMN-binding protein [Bacteroidota bacterium]
MGILIIIIITLTSYFSQTENNIPYSKNKKIIRKIEQKTNIANPHLKSFSTGKNITEGEFFLIYTEKESSNPHYYLYIGRVNSCRSRGCNINGTSQFDKKKNENLEYFDHLILFDTTGTIRYTDIFNYQASHGHEVTSRWWLKQFKGYQGHSALSENNQIDGISGATISVRSMIADVVEKTKILKTYLNQNIKK